MIADAYKQICSESKKCDSCYVSLYEQTSHYGGPEEGGWWYNNAELVETQHCATRLIAEQLVTAINDKVQEMSKQSQQLHGEKCLRELAYCDARGIDDSDTFFGVDDGPSKYFVVIENVPGSQTNHERPHYE